MAHPDAELTVDGQRRPVRARQATDEEKADLWPRVVAAYRGYAGYQRRTQRDIPLVLCDPR
jgi:deazaflavin-dependent oxidoreductase (nitroreductase family)